MSCYLFDSRLVSNITLFEDSPKTGNIEMLEKFVLNKSTKSVLNFNHFRENY